MSHSFTHLVYHIVYATKHRSPCIEEAIQPDLYALLGNVVHSLGGVSFAVNGMSDHVHLLARLPASRALSDVVRAMKTSSSTRLGNAVPGFAWQTGYGAFTVSKSNEETVRRYVEHQKRHHAERNYLDEFRALLKAHDFDPADAEAHME
jgi:REP element-mobilizing transposase RayT